MYFIILLVPSMLMGADFEIEIQDAKLSSSRQELAEIIVDSFLKTPRSSLHTSLHPRVEKLLESESEEFCTILSKHAHSNHDLTPVVADQVSERVLQIFTQAVEIVVKEKEEEIVEKNSRCKRSTVIILSTLLGLGTAAATAAITTAVTLAITNN